MKMSWRRSSIGSSGNNNNISNSNSCRWRSEAAMLLGIVLFGLQGECIHPENMLRIHSGARWSIWCTRMYVQYKHGWEAKNRTTVLWVERGKQIRSGIKSWVWKCIFEEHASLYFAFYAELIAQPGMSSFRLKFNSYYWLDLTATKR